MVHLPISTRKYGETAADTAARKARKSVKPLTTDYSETA
jgi:hypothetical protein